MAEGTAAMVESLIKNMSPIPEYERSLEHSPLEQQPVTTRKRYSRSQRGKKDLSPILGDLR